VITAAMLQVTIGSVSGSFSYWLVKGTASVEAKSSGTVTAKTRRIVATMRIERYYSSVREELSPLSEDALTLLDRQDVRSKLYTKYSTCSGNYRNIQVHFNKC